MAPHAAPITRTSGESPEEAEARIRWEAAEIAAGDAEIDAGLGIELEDLQEWLAALDVDENTPLPEPRPNLPPQ